MSFPDLPEREDEGAGLDVRSELHGLRILAACDFFSPDSSGGIERVLEQVARRLSQWGAEVTVLAAMPRRMRPFELNGHARVDVARLHDLSGLAGAQAGFAPHILHLARQAIKQFKPDVLFANGLHFQSSLALALAKPNRSIPLVTTAHIGGLDFLPQPTRAVATLYERTAGRLILGRSRRVVAVAETVIEHLLKLGVNRERIDLIPNGVDLEKFRPRRHQRDGPPVIMFVGRLTSNKGPDILLEALDTLNRERASFRAAFLGDGPLRRALEARARDSDLPVEFRGHVHNVSDVITDADVVVRPSLTEGHPLTVLEAMAAGICVVASDIPANCSLVTDGLNGMTFRAGDPTSLASTLAAVIEDPALRTRLAGKGRETALQFSWDTCAQRTASTLLAATRNGRL